LLDMLHDDHYSDHMAKTVTATEAKAHILALLDDVEAGEEIEITRHGRLVARLVPARGGAALMGKYAGLAWTNVEDEELLFSTGEEWSADEDNLA
jgi:prevent-host-death family protein